MDHNIVIRVGIELQPVKRDPLDTDGDLGQIGADIRVKAVLVHPQEIGRIAQPNQAGTSHPRLLRLRSGHPAIPTRAARRTHRI